ncbi:MAG: AAA family ATPase [Nostoc sp. CreGUA01]|nr:ATP-binding protein [Nostoc sp. CreGUA01]
MTIDLQSSSDDWPYEEEEYPIYCMLGTSQLFSCQPLGEPAVVLHRFGGSYGAAEFLLTAAQEEMQGEITVTLVNSWGMPIRVLSLGKISVTQVVTPHPVTIGTRERVTSIPQILGRNSSTNYTRNPYIISTPIHIPEKLFGRELIFNKIQDSLQQGEKFILLYGQRRIGKSSILRNIPFLISQNEFVFVTCDLQEHGNSSLGGILYAIASDIVESLDIDKTILNSIKTPDFDKNPSILTDILLPTVYDILGNKKLVLLFDDFDVVSQNGREQSFHFLRFLENLLRQEELYVIAVASRTLSAMPNLLQLFRDAPVIEIGGLDEESIKQFITVTDGDYLKYEPKAIEAIINLSAGHPYFLQILCFAIFSRARELKKYNITEEDVEIIVDKAIELAEGGFAWYWYTLSILEQVVFSAVAEAQKQNISQNPLKLLEDYGLMITDPLEEAIQLLINKDFLNINPIKIKIELVYRWLLQRHPLRDEIWQLKTLPNRDIHSVQPSQPFVGRASEVAAALDQIYNRSHLAIWGGRGMGKTSFLHKLESPQAWEEHGVVLSEAVIVRFSCEQILPFTPVGFWKKILSLLKDNLHAEPELHTYIDTLLIEGRTSRDSLRQILRKLKRKEKFLVLLIDDYDVALVENPEYSEHDMQMFLSECRNLAVHSAEGQHMSMIVTSLKRLHQLGPKLNPNAAPWYNHYLFLRLKTFNKAEIDEFLQCFNKKITSEIQEAIKEISGSHPTLLQISSSLISRKIESSNSLDAQEIVNELKSSTRQFFVSIWHRCSQMEQTLLILLALSNLRSRLHQNLSFDLSSLGLIFSQRERELIKLEEQGILTHTIQEEKNIYSFSSSIIELWVIQELQQTNEKWLPRREKVFLNFISSEEFHEFTTAIKWVWNNKNQIPSDLWFGKLVTAIQQRIER